MYNASRFKTTIGKDEVKSSDFRRFCEVLPTTFNEMVNCLKRSKFKGRKTGSMGKLCFEDQVLVMLEYYRNYSSMVKLGLEYGVDETTIGRIICRVEKVLISSNSFKLPSKKVIREGNLQLEAVIVDATEMQIQKPKRLRFKLKKNQK